LRCGLVFRQRFAANANCRLVRPNLDDQAVSGYDEKLMATVAQITTAEQLFREPGLGRCELLRGELVLMSPSGSLHAFIAARLAKLLGNFVERRELGCVFGAEGGFQIGHDPDTVRAPDVAFVSAARMPATIPAGFFPGPPDLAVEVLSPNDRPTAVLAKVSDWLAAGCRMVWVVDPGARTVTLYAPNEEVRMFHLSDAITGAEVLPGFQVELAKIFPA
jgi:Uma2 family endonuclease